MNYTEIIVAGFALAMDATVYSFSYGLVLRKRRVSSALWFALTVGLFQSGMPLIGYLGGTGLKDMVPAWDHWIVLAVFIALGGSIIRHAWVSDEEEGNVGTEPLTPAALLLAGFATSIDALAVGACMALGNIGGAIETPRQLGIAVGLIGLITAVCSLSAFRAAKLLHRLPSRWLETLAGTLLIGLGAQNCLRDLGML